MAEGSTQLKYSAVALAIAFTLGACTPIGYGTAPPPVRTPVPAPTPPQPTVVIKPVPEDPVTAPGEAEPSTPSPTTTRTAPSSVPVSSASQALLTQSRGHQAAKRYGQAAASIERALRIEPRQPVLWLELGNIRLKEGDFAQAESLGRKALSLSTGNPTLVAKAEQLIATAKRR
jgi:hypothetical protein